MKLLGLSWLAFAAVASTLPAQTLAQTSMAEPLTPAAALHSARTAGFDNPVPAVMLGDFRGGSDLVHNEMTLAGTTAGNTAINVATGTNTINAGAFANMSGLPLVVQNSGANVLIQNAVILNLQMN